jgi:hypothetical protein
MQVVCSSSSYWSKVSSKRWSCLSESVDDLVPVRVCFNQRSLNMAPTYRLTMSPSGGGVMHREDREGGIISPSTSPTLEDLDSVGYPPPAPSPPDRWCFGLVFSPFEPASSHLRTGLPPFLPYPRVDWHTMVCCGHP